MRMAFGFVGLLITVALMLFLWNWYTGQVASTAAPARSAAEQIAGVESSGLGGHASDWVKLSDYSVGGKLQGINVTQVTTGSSMQAYFGLQAGDRIINVGPQSIKDIGDPELAKALIAEAYQRQWTLVVLRGQQQLELPQAKKWNVATPSPTPAPAPAPAAPSSPQAGAPAPGAAPAAPPAQRVSPMQRQLDLIRGAGDRTE